MRAKLLSSGQEWLSDVVKQCVSIVVGKKQRLYSKSNILSQINIRKDISPENLKSYKIRTQFS